MVRLLQQCEVTVRLHMVRILHHGEVTALW